MGLIAGVTEHIGLGATYSTTYYTPFHVARTFATLDHLSGGRAAWNVVTSVNDSEARNFGVTERIGHDERYDRADEFLEATTGLWDTWEDDALVLDRESGYFADPDKVTPLDYRESGSRHSDRSPCLGVRRVAPCCCRPARRVAVATSPPVGPRSSSPAIPVSRWPPRTTRIRSNASASSAATRAAVRMLPMLYTVVGESKAHAEEREQTFLNDLVDPQASLTLLSELMNHDFAGYSLDEPITDELVENISGIRGLVENLRAHIGGEVTLADLAGHRATLLQGPRFVGTATDVADQMQQWFEADACDGFVIAATHTPGAYEDVVRLVVPELQRRGLFRDRYTGSTLRETLGLPRPEVDTSAHA